MKNRVVTLVFVGIAILASGFFVTKKIKSMKIENDNFNKKLEAILELTENKYKSSGNRFAINLSNKHSVVFQLIERTLLENTEGTEFGYGIHLPFDDSFPEAMEELERFLSSGFSNQFDYHVWDGIATYQLDLKMDKERIIEMSRKVAEVVYQEELTEIEFDEFGI